MLKEKLQAVLSLVDGAVESILIQDENTIEIDGAEYRVLTDDEADEEYYNYQESIWDDLGIEAFTGWAKDYILENLVDENWFNEAMRESYQFYIDDIKNESASNGDFENRLDEEIAEAGVETEEEYLDYLCEQYDNGIEWYKSEFGIKQMSEAVKNNNLVDFESVVEWTKETDGRGCMASYDGEENESNGYYIYRTN